MTHYRVSWEMPDVLRELERFAGVPNEQIPDEYWHRVVRETEDPWDQYRTLRAWAESGVEQVRNVQLERMETEPRWVVLDDRA